MADNCKFQKIQYQVSYDSGTTWENVVPAQYRKGELLEYDSPDCSGIDILYKWRTVEGEYLCDENSKYTKEIQEESYNNGITWYTTFPTVYRQGQYVGEDAEFCCDKFVGHYIYIEPPTPTQHYCPPRMRWNGTRCVPLLYDPLKIVKCDSTSTLVRNDTLYYSDNYHLENAEIGNSVTSISGKTFSGCTSLTSITIPDSVTSIGSSAFTNCSGLTSIEIPSGVTSIGEYVFYDCRSLTSISIPNGVTSIGGRAFAFCSSITSIDIPDSVTSISTSAFYNCSGLVGSIVIPSGITSIGQLAFCGCSGLTSITADRTTPPTLGDSAFDNTNNCPIYVPCESLFAYRTASGWAEYFDRIQGIPPCSEPTPTADTKFYATYNDNKYYFKYCDSSEYLFSADTKPNGFHYGGMTSAEIGNCVTTISSGVFANCTSLSSVTIPNSVTYIVNGHYANGNGAFQNCTSLKSIIMPSGVTHIGSCAFYNCNGLTNIICLATTPPTLGDSAFDNTNNCPIYVPCESLFAYRTASGWAEYFERIQGIPPCSEPTPTGGTKFYATYNDNTSYSAECVSVGELTTATTKSNGHDYSGMTSAEIGNCVTTIGQYAFRDCINLTSCTLGYYVSSISNAVFYNCSGLTSIEIPSGVRSIGWGVFASCTNITNIVLPSNISSIGNQAFSGCTRLTSVTVNATTPPSLGWSTTSSEGPLSDAFSDCPCTIYVPCGSINAYRTDEVWSYYASRIVGIPPCSEPAPTGSTKLITTYESGAKHYVYCNSSSTITSNEKTTRGFRMSMIDAEIGDCVTTIGNNAFSGCTSLRSVTIPDSVTSIYKEAFRICTSLSSVTIPDSVTSIGVDAFRECSGLTSVTIGSGVTSISGSAFSNCSGLTSIEIPSGVTFIGQYAFYKCTSLTSITVDRTTPPTLGGYGAFNNTNNCPIYVPSASVETYKSARYWSDFADRIQAIPT